MTNKRTSSLTASIFWDRTKDSLKTTFTGSVKLKQITTHLRMLFKEWKKVENSYLDEINHLTAENELLRSEIQLLNHQLTQRNELVRINAALHKELHYYKHHHKTEPLPVDAHPLSLAIKTIDSPAEKGHIIPFPTSIAAMK
jgi:cell shape-determining protein MreC